MTDAEAIQQLKTVPPRVELTGWARFWRAVQAVCSVIAVVSLCIGLVAVIRLGVLAACTNDNLGTRSAPSAADAQAHIEFADLVLDAFAQQPTLDLAEQARRRDAFIANVRKYKATLAADQASRNAHPLGKC